MTKQDFVNAFYNQLTDSEIRKQYTPAGTPANQAPNAGGAGAATAAIANGPAGPDGVARSIDDWWLLVADNAAGAYAAAGELGGAGPSAVNVPANTFKANEITANSHMPNYTPLFPNRIGINDHVENWAGIAGAAGANNWDEEFLGHLLGKICNNGWKSTDIYRGQRIGGVANNVIMAVRGFDNSPLEGINELLGHGSEIDSWKNNFKHYLLDANSITDEGIEKWRWASRSGLAIANYLQWISAHEAATLHNKKWTIDDLGVNGGNRIIGNIFGANAFSVGSYNYNGGGVAAANKNALVHPTFPNKEDGWKAAFNAVGGDSANADKATSSSWLKLRYLSNQQGSLLDNQKINATEAANLFNNKWMSYHFEIYNHAGAGTPLAAVAPYAVIGNHLQTLGGYDMIGASRRTLAEINGIGNRETTFFTGFAGATGNFSTKLSETKDSDKDIMREYLKLFDPLKDLNGNNISGAKGITTNNLSAAQVGDLHDRDWRVKDIHEARTHGNAPAALKGDPLVVSTKNGDILSRTGALTAYENIVGSAVALGFGAYGGGQGNTRKSLFIDGFKGAGAGNLASSMASDSEIILWMDKPFNGAQAGGAFNNGWKLAEINANGEVSYRGKEWSPWQWTRQSVDLHLKMLGEDKEKEKTPKEDKEKEKTPKEKAVDELAELIKKANDALAKSGTTKSEINSLIKELKVFSEGDDNMKTVAYTEKFNEVNELMEKLKNAEKTAPETRPVEETPPAVDGKPAVDSTSSAPTKEQIENAEKVIAGKLKEKGIKKEEFIKTLKDKPEFKGKSLSQILNSFKTTQELNNFKAESLNSIENQQAQGHFSKYKWWYIGGGTILLAAIGFGVWKMFFSKEQKEEEE